MPNEILFPILILGGLGVLATVILFIAAKFMRVPVDERALALRAVLPGANCGACGYAGCDDYAKALAAGGVKTNLCVPGGDTCAKDISEILGTEAEDIIEKKAFVRCGGTCGNTEKLFRYEGTPTCHACNAFYAGNGTCNYMCLGYGDCIAACKFEAISIKDGIAVIDRQRCTGCGMCKEACPNNLITMEGDAAQVFVRCHNPSKGATTRKACKVGCIGCHACEKVCPTGAITVEDNLARVDQSKCTQCGACVEKCPTNAIVDLRA